VPCYRITRDSAEYPELSGKLKRIEPFVTLIEKYRERKDTEPVDLLTQDLVAELGLIEELLAEDAVIGQTRVENIEAFIEGTATYAHTNGEAHLDNYLAEISLYIDIDAYQNIDDKATLMTIHSAKGLEYATVFMVGLEEGLFPLPRTISEPAELEEERRLFYVGATRARQKLYLSTAGSRFRFGEVMSIPSRFIKEIPDDLVNRYDLSAHRHREHKPTSVTPGRKANTPTGVHYEFEADEIMQVGRLVAHPTFGRGKILKVVGYGESLQLEIMFTGLGVKNIMVRYAKLKVIG